jgi:hypothetical protein
MQADGNVPLGLDTSEAQLYQRLLSDKRGRLEQEFLPSAVVHRKLKEWIER